MLKKVMELYVDGKGFWVAPLPERKKQTMAKERFTDALERLVAHALAEGMSAANMRRILNAILKEGRGR